MIVKQKQQYSIASRCISSVSYTHLDVYKRQPLWYNVPLKRNIPTILTDSWYISHIDTYQFLNFQQVTVNLTLSTDLLFKVCLLYTSHPLAIDVFFRNIIPLYGLENIEYIASGRICYCFWEKQ